MKDKLLNRENNGRTWENNGGQWRTLEETGKTSEDKWEQWKKQGRTLEIKYPPYWVYPPWWNKISSSLKLLEKHGRTLEIKYPPYNKQGGQWEDNGRNREDIGNKNILHIEFILHIIKVYPPHWNHGGHWENIGVQWENI